MFPQQPPLLIAVRRGRVRWAGPAPYLGPGEERGSVRSSAGWAWRARRG